MINQVSLTGRLGADIDLRYSPQGTAVGSFRLAVSRLFTKEGQQDTDWINCVCFKKTAENASNFTRKGSLVGVTGRLQSRTYEKDGRTVYVTEVICDNVIFLDSKKDNQQNNQQSNGQQNQQQNNQQQQDPFANNGEPIDISDQDLPF